MKKPQTIFRNAAPERPYTQLCNAMLTDSSISLDTLGLLCRVMSLPRRWVFHRNAYRKSYPIGEKKLDRILKDAVSAGYARYEQSRNDDGTHGQVVYYFTDVSGVFDGDLDDDRDPKKDGAVKMHRDPKSGGAVQRVAANGGPYKGNTSKKEKLDKHPLTPSGEAAVAAVSEPFQLELEDAIAEAKAKGLGAQALGSQAENAGHKPISASKPKKPKVNRAPAYTPEFETIWGKWPRKDGKCPAFTSWSKVLDDDHSRIEAIIDRVVDSFKGTELRYVPLLSTWINQRRFDDDPVSRKAKVGEVDRSSHFEVFPGMWVPRKPSSEPSDKTIAARFDRNEQKVAVVKEMWISAAAANEIIDLVPGVDAQQVIEVLSEADRKPDSTFYVKGGFGGNVSRKISIGAIIDWCVTKLEVKKMAMNLSVTA